MCFIFQGYRLFQKLSHFRITYLMSLFSSLPFKHSNWLFIQRRLQVQPPLDWRRFRPFLDHCLAQYKPGWDFEVSDRLIHLSCFMQVILLYLCGTFMITLVIYTHVWFWCYCLFNIGKMNLHSWSDSINRYSQIIDEIRMSNPIKLVKMLLTF